MITKGKNYIIIQKLKMIKRVMNNKSKDSLFHEFGIPRETICSWMKEEKLCSSIDSLVDRHRDAKKEG
jgi:hypothetical protein